MKTRSTASPEPKLTQLTFGRSKADPEYPLERLCVHRYQPFQLKFARHAQQLLLARTEFDSHACHRGLLLRGETEAAIDQAVVILREYFGSQIRIEPLRIRYHQGHAIEEPHMRVRIGCSLEHFEAVRDDLVSRTALILDSSLSSKRGVLRATGPLVRLLGYRQSFGCGSAQTGEPS